MSCEGSVKNQLKKKGVDVLENITEKVDKQKEIMKSNGKGPDFIGSHLNSYLNSAVTYLVEGIKEAASDFTDLVQKGLDKFGAMLKYLNLLNPNLYMAVMVQNTAKTVMEDLKKDERYLHLVSQSLNELIIFMRKYLNTASGKQNIIRFLNYIKQANRTIKKVRRTLGENESANDTAFYKPSDIEAAIALILKGTDSLMDEEQEIVNEVNRLLRIKEDTETARKRLKTYYTDPSYELYVQEHALWLASSESNALEFQGTSEMNNNTVSNKILVDAEFYNQINRERKDNTFGSTVINYSIEIDEVTGQEVAVITPSTNSVLEIITYRLIQRVLTRYASKQITNDDLVTATGHSLADIQKAQSLIGVGMLAMSPLSDMFRELAKRMLGTIYTMSEGQKIPKHILDDIISIDTFTSLSGKGITRYGLRTLKSTASLTEVILPILGKSYQDDSGVVNLPEELNYSALSAIRWILIPTADELDEFEGDIENDLATISTYALSGKKHAYYLKAHKIAVKLGLVPSYFAELNDDYRGMREYYDKFPAIKIELESLMADAKFEQLSESALNIIIDLPRMLFDNPAELEEKITSVQNLKTLVDSERSRSLSMIRQLRKLTPSGVDSIDEASQIMNNLTNDLGDFKDIVSAGFIVSSVGLFSSYSDGCENVTDTKKKSDTKPNPDPIQNNYDKTYYNEVEQQTKQYEEWLNLQAQGDEYYKTQSYEIENTRETAKNIDTSHMNLNDFGH